jgi:ribosomal protein S18 acetylase RimI-like enzyme
MKISIRNAGLEDWKIIQKIGLTVFDANKSYDPDLDMNWPTSENGIENYKQVVSSNGNCKLIAEVDNVPVGYLIGGKFKYDYRKVTYGEIQDMGVLPDFRRQGIGSKLVDEFRKWAKSKGYEKVYVNAYYDDERAVGFYKKQGLIPSDLVLIGRV